VKTTVFAFSPVDQGDGDLVDVGHGIAGQGSNLSQCLVQRLFAEHNLAQLSKGGQRLFSATVSGQVD